MTLIRFLVLLLGFLATAAAQDGNPTVIALLPLAYDPVEVHKVNGELVIEPDITEYVVLKQLIYSEGTQPERIDIVALIENTSDRDIREVRVTLEMSRRVTDFDGAGREPPVGEWQDWAELESHQVNLMPARTVVKNIFAGIDIQSLWQDLPQIQRWASEIRFRLVTQCAGCLPRESRQTPTVAVKPAG